MVFTGPTEDSQKALEIAIPEKTKRKNITFWQGSKLKLANSQNATDFDNCEGEKYPLANVCELESSLSPKPQLASIEEVLLIKLCKWTEMLTSSPDSSLYDFET